ncbi:cell division protein ZapA [Amphritea opalescens]|uniref:Cell division protein ZapA n=1 Tax=Amphritea opalescens TaxID=2490544 RepID=A0A430KNA6_9GAMM|nr:cell division protein ZapA [Amphritea opalescens]RTE64977.1 cell division protein ZapA [Amphritea opalescens]
MSSSPRNISVTLLGKEYVVACPAEAEAELLKAAAYLDKKMQDIRAGGRIIGSEKVAVMAALNITYELQSSQTAEREAVNSRLSHLSLLLEKTLAE